MNTQMNTQMNIEEEEYFCDTCECDLDPNDLIQVYHDASVYLCEECRIQEEEDEDAEVDEYMEEDMGQCPKCNCSVKRGELAWRIGYYLDICSKCDFAEQDSEDARKEEVKKLEEQKIKTV